ncbi:hypothetical protein L4D15_19430 [Enterovibrio norvegicus]|uniref:hypothetical protein n=1 Tax=Enterovibrio norvegicus TaxID=188144 RepID=UPI003D0DD4AA
MLAKNITLLTVLSALTACGGGGEGSTTDTGTPSSQTSTYTVIDGYLGNAEVYVDRNANLVAESFELLGNTNEKGEISVEASDDDYALIVRIIAGVTTDSDIDGTVAFNKEYVSSSDSKVITPATTLARLNDMSLASLSSALNISPDDMNADFIAAQKHKAHVLNRSLNLLLGETLDTSRRSLEEMLQNAQKISDYIGTQPPATDLTDLILVINEGGDILHSTPKKVHNTQFDLAGMTLQWEQKDYSGVDYTDPDGRFFHPCYMSEFGADLLLVSNCYDEKYLTLDTHTGAIVSVSPTVQNNYLSYIDGDYVALVANDGNITYLDKSLQPANPSAEVLKKEKDRLVAGIGKWAYLDKDNIFSRILRDSPEAFLKNKHLYKAEAMTYRYVGEITSFFADGSVTTQQGVPSSTIRNAVIAIHNASSLGFTANSDNTRVEWLAPNVYLTRVDTEQRFISNDYQYLYFSDGRIQYLGQMDQGFWMRGADDTTIIYYDVSKQEGEGHLFKQFSLKTGEELAQWQRTAQEISANLYGHLHTKNGLYTNSNSYSTIIKFK